jgi:hypothetical protein
MLHVIFYKSSQTYGTHTNNDKYKGTEGVSRCTVKVIYLEKLKITYNLK